MKKYTCKDCKYYKPIDETKRDCFGHQVPAICQLNNAQLRLLNEEKRKKKNDVCHSPIILFLGKIKYGKGYPC